MKQNKVTPKDRNPAYEKPDHMTLPAQALRGEARASHLPTAEVYHRKRLRNLPATQKQNIHYFVNARNYSPSQPFFAFSTLPPSYASGLVGNYISSHNQNPG